MKGKKIIFILLFVIITLLLIISNCQITNENDNYIGTWEGVSNSVYCAIIFKNDSYEFYTYKGDKKESGLAEGYKGDLKISDDIIELSSKQSYNIETKLWETISGNTVKIKYSVKDDKITIIFDINNDGNYDINNGDIQYILYKSEVPFQIDTTSMEILNWKKSVDNATQKGRIDHSSVVFDNKMWIIGGQDSSSSLNDVWYSSDGITWTLATDSANFGSLYGHSSVVFDNKMWVIAGQHSSSRTNDVWYSSDGVTWSLATDSAGFSGRYNHSSVVFDNKIWVIAGEAYEKLNDVWYSSDGVTWTLATDSAGFSIRSGHTSVIFDNKIWVIAGMGEVIGYSDIWYSSDGITWIKSSDSINDYNSSICDHSTVVFENKIWIINKNSPYGKNDIYFSEDGKEFILAVVDNIFSARENFSSIVFNNKIWLMSGNIYYPNKYFYDDVWYCE